MTLKKKNPGFNRIPNFVILNTGEKRKKMGQVGFGYALTHFDPTRFNLPTIDPYLTRPYSTHNPFQPVQICPFASSNI